MMKKMDLHVAEHWINDKIQSIRINWEKKNKTLAV